MQVKKWIVSFLLIGCVIFAVSPGLQTLLNPSSVWDIREQIVFLTGVWAISLMTLAVITSARFAVVNNMMGGLDKAYFIHKWAGIYAFIFSLLHWLTEKLPGWLIGLNIIAHPGELGDGSRFSQLDIMLFQSGVLLAEIAFYLLVVLILLSLIKKVPYHVFQKLHKVFPVIFIILAYHAATAQNKEDWLSSPAGYLLLILLVIGVGAALVSLCRKIGVSNQANATIQTVNIHQNTLLEIELQVLDKPFAYQAGQYIFLTFTHSKESHPFSIASFNDDQSKLRIAIKELGDFTRDLKNHIVVGQTVLIEGPYGEFTFDDSCERQVWIAGGIGITPFIARLEELALRQDHQTSIDFYYCSRGDVHEQYPAFLTALCQKANVNLHPINSSKEEYLSVASFKDLNQTRIWFCGPSAFAESLQQDLKRHGFNLKQFHYDRFTMR